ncbi:MAG: DUF4388 domain-containing protein [Thermomicrobiales bacterium]
MGETVDIGVAELLSVLARRRHARRLTITADGDEVQTFLNDGKVILMSSSNHSLRLGRVLVRLGVIDQERLDAAIQEQDRNGRGRPLGQILIDRGWAGNDDLARAAEEQCVDALTRVIVAKHGSFMFNRDAAPLAKRGLVSLNTDGIVLEASRRADEMVTLRSLLPPSDALLSLPRAGAGSAAGSACTLLETRVIEELRRETGSLADLAQRIPVPEVALWRSVIGLRERGLLVAGGGGGADDFDDAPVDDAAPPRVLEVIIGLGIAGRQAGSTRMPTLPKIRSGVFASAQTVAALTGVIREVIAAFNAQLALRAFAHFTDDHFRRGGPMPVAEIESLRHPGIPLPPERQEVFVDLRDVRLLQDGRASAILVTRIPDVGDTKKVLVFARAADRWLIDAVIEAPSSGPSMTSMLRPLDAPAPVPSFIR